MASDPRLDPDYRDQGVLPVVERPRSGLSGFAIGMVAVVIGLLLFLVLNGRRQSLSAPAVTERSIEAPATSVPPPLYQPAPLPPVVVAAPPPAPALQQPPAAAPPVQPQSQAAPPVIAPRAYVAEAEPARQPARPPGALKSAIVTDNSQARAVPSNQETPTLLAGSLSAVLMGTDRARSGTLANPATTVPQGTSIPAVLETAIDSTRPSMVVALVQRDVRGFDGSRVLIPRGSRLNGELRTDTLPGQNRANVIWTRLILPDGTTIGIGSPAADTLGRAGVRGNVDGHFWQRFGGALLQSSLDIGAALAARSGNGGVVLLPGSISNVSSTATGSLFRPTTAPPTIKVPAGRSVSVAVARDLDFTGTAN